MEDLGELGFWLAAGMVVAALIVAHGLKEREKERQKQETLRALLTTEGKSTTEILAYMRERDAADAAREHAIWVASQVSTRKILAVAAAFVAGVASFLASVAILNRATGGAGDVTHQWPVAVGLILGPIAVGILLAVLVYVLVRGKKNVPPPGA